MGTLRVACFVDADAPGRVSVFVASARKKEKEAFEDDSDDEGRGARDASSSSRGEEKNRFFFGTWRKDLRRAFSSSSASYVRVSLNRVDFGAAPKKDDRRRTATARLKPDKNLGMYVFDESFTYEHVDPDGDSSVSFELFRENALGGDDDPVAQFSLPVKHLPRARDGDAAARPRDRTFRVHSRSKRHLSRNETGEKSTGEVCVSACFLDKEKTRLRVRVLEARDMRAGDKTGTSDPYVTATLLDGSDQDRQVFRTKVVYGTTSPAWRHEFYFRVNAAAAGPDGTAAGSSARTNCFGGLSDDGVLGQAVLLDLFDHDFGDFDADDFLGRVVLPLESIATTGVGPDAERRAEWYPWRDLKRANPLKGEVLVRAYFPFESEEDASPDTTPLVDNERALLDPSLNANAAALQTRSLARDAHAARVKAKRLELEKHGLRRELEAQLRVQLQAHDWPTDLASRYARAYAKHAHESHRIPPPPLGLVVPASFAHMFETAERAAGVFSESSSFARRRETSEGDGDMEGESADPGGDDEHRRSEHVPVRVPEHATGATDVRSAPSVPSWSIAAGGAASVYFQRSPTRRL